MLFLSTLAPSLAAFYQFFLLGLVKIDIFQQTVFFFFFPSLEPFLLIVITYWHTTHIIEPLSQHVVRYNTFMYRQHPFN